MSEKDYIRGSRMAWLTMLQQCIKQLGYDDPEVEHLKWISERELAISALRDVCKDYGDMDWEENLHLADIIENTFIGIYHQEKPKMSKTDEEVTEILLSAKLAIEDVLQSEHVTLEINSTTGEIVVQYEQLTYECGVDNVREITILNVPF